MKIFLREHLLLMVIQTLQFLIIVGVFWLAGFRNLPLALYTVFLSFFLLFIYLLYHYFSRRKFYDRLNRMIDSLDESFQVLDRAPISQALQQLLKTQYNQFQQQITLMDKRQEEHLKFMDLWIHQMKTPLSVIELSAQELEEPDSSNIREEVDRLKNGLNTVLHMSRLRMLDQDFHTSYFSLNELLREISEENKRLFIRHKVYPKIIENAEVRVHSDEKWLFFMINQLLQNAVKYSAEKADEMQMKVYEREGNSVLEIRDFGIGIPTEDIKRIYDAFFTGQNGRKYRESTGVGLYLTNEVAEYLGHQLEVESTVGKGTAFRIVF